jgi:hypothetical protein
MSSSCRRQNDARGAHFAREFRGDRRDSSFQRSDVAAVFDAFVGRFVKQGS